MDLLLLSIMPALLLCSAFFSGAETALFGMSEADRQHFRRGRSLAARSVQALLVDPRMLLITLLLGNMTINSVYFVISSVMMMRNPWGVGGQAVLAASSLLAMLIAGEVLPKMIADARRVRFATVTAPLLRFVHVVVAPIRVPVERFIVRPLGRLTAPDGPPDRLSEEELHALIELSSHQGVIEAEEQQVLREVFELRRLRVRDVMTPRVRVRGLVTDATRADVVAATRETRLTHLPVYQDSLDDIKGILHVKRYLLSADPEPSIADLLAEPTFVPQMATLDQLLEHFRSSHAKSAIVVDEYGGTAGIVAVRDVAEELVGEIVGEDETASAPPVMIGLNQWRASGDMSIHEWAEAFGEQLVSPEVATLGGLIMERLGRAPDVGDTVDLRNVRLEVEQVERSRVVTALITLRDEDEETAS